MEHRREIDGLRTVAVFAVMMFHAGLAAFSGGFVGVDVFFVISGFLITTIILSEIGQGTFSVARFYERRARRILPALFLVLCCCVPAAWFLLLPGDMKSFSQSLAAVSVFGSNILFWRTTGYFETATELKPLLHTWSLAIEEQYYVFFPILLVLLSRKGRRLTLVVLLGLFFVSLFLAQWGAKAAPVMSFYTLPTRGWELLLGGLVAFYMASGNRYVLGRRMRELGGGVGLALILYGMLAYGKQTPFPGVYALVPTLGTALILVCAAGDTLVGRVLGTRLLVGGGLISYSAYLWHQPLFAFARHYRSRRPEQAVFAGLIVLSFALAYLSWKFVETPFRDKNRFSRKQIFRMGALGTLLIGAMGLAGMGMKGIPARFIDLASILPTRSDDLQRVDQCFLLNAMADALDVEKCTQKTEGKKFNVLLLGDSHAASLYPGLRAFLDRNDVQLSMMAASYCLPLVDRFPRNASQTATPRCAAINHRINEVLASRKFDLVVVASFVLQYGFRNDWEWSYEGYYDDYLAALKNLNARTKTLVIGSFVIWGDTLPNVVGRESLVSGIRSVDAVPRFSRVGVDAQLLAVDQRVKDDAQAAGIGFLSLVDAMCRDGACMRYVPSSQGNRLVAFDYGHLGLEGSRYVADHHVGPKILEALGSPAR
jgi:peptidoglycan/LPS O-acetylase OafA/YrhL